MRVDADYCARAADKTKRKIASIRRKILASPEAKLWGQKYRRKTNLTSITQLADILFNDLGYKPKVFTEKGQPATSESALEEIDAPFVRDYFRMKKLIKARSTYLKAIIREEVNGFIHPFFNLHLVRSYRSSSDSPNFQNIPTRDPDIGKLVRSAFLPRPGRRLMEIDFSGIEVRVAACYHKDPNMIDYIKDPSKDMHRDMAMECYRLPEDQVSKQIRYCGKNMFVFPQFYGDWYLACARNLWEAADRMKLTLTDGTPLKEHLRSEGLKELGACDPKEKARPGTFERHIQDVERRFWEDRFPVYASWKNKWHNNYKARGYFDTLTGFRCSGYMTRNEAINLPVQGSAFHCLLWSLCEILDWIHTEQKQSLIVGQIHDSIVADVVPEEQEEFVEVATEVMTRRLRETWDWIIVPIEIEVEASPVDGSWWEKEKLS